MPENKGLNFGVSFNINDEGGSLANLSSIVDQINKDSGKLASTLSGVEKAYNGLAQATEKYNKELKEANKSGISTTEQFKADARMQLADKKKSNAESLMETKKQKDKELLEEKRLNAEKLAEKNRAIAKEALNDRVAAAERLAEDKQNKAKELLELKNANAQKLYDQKKADAEISRLEREATKQKKIELNQQLADYNRVASEMKSGAKELGKLTNLNTNLGNANSLKASIFSAGIELMGVRALANAFSDLGQDIIDVNYNAINTQRVMKDFSAETTQYLIDGAIDMANQTGIQVVNAQKIQSSWARVNDEYSKNKETLSEISLLTAKFMSVAEIEDADEAVKLLNATLLQFKEEGVSSIEMATEVMNKWAYMADKTALGTADEFGASLAKMGGFMKSVEGNVDDAIVLTSIVGDRLAKTGEEAGNSLKTILSYLTRAKTVNLFDSLGEDVNGVSYSMKQANGEFKNFEGLMSTAARAYNDFKMAGDDTTVKKIQEAIGATRQGDVALSLLQNWEADSAKYYGMIEASSAGTMSYLDEQNAVLMTSFKNQWNSLYATILGAGTAIANSGMLSGLTNIMGVLDDVFTAFKNLNPEVLEFITILGSVALGGMAIKYVGELTGVTKLFTTAMTLGTVEQRKNAAAVAQNADAHFAMTKASLGTETQIKKETSALAIQKAAYNKLTQMYEKGIITSKQYTTATEKLIGAENLKAQTDLKEAEATKTSIALQAAGIPVGKAYAAARDQTTAATWRQITAQKVLNGVTQLGQSIMSMINPMTIAMVAIAAITKVIDIFTTSAEEQKAKIDELASSLDNLNTEYKYLNEKDANGSITPEEKERIAFLKELIPLEEEKLKIEKKKAAQKEFDGPGLGTKTIDIIKAYKSLYDKEGVKNVSAPGMSAMQVETVTAIDGMNRFKKEIEDTQKAYDAATESRKKWVSMRDSTIKDSEDWKKYNKLVGESTEAEKSAKDSLDEKVESYKVAQANVMGLSEKIKEYMDLDIIDKNDQYWVKLAEKIGVVKDEAKEVISVAEKLNGIDISFDLGVFNTEQEGIKKNISLTDDYITKVKDGTLAVEDQLKMMTDYSGSDFFQISNKGAGTYLDFLKQINEENYASIRNNYDEQRNKIYQARIEILKTIEGMEKNEKGEIIDVKAYQQAMNMTSELDKNLNLLNAQSDIELFVESSSLQNAVDMMGELVDSTTELVRAQEQLAAGTALSVDQLYNLAMRYPELMTQADLFNTTSVEGQQNAINAVMDMKQQEFTAKVDIQIQELMAEQDAINTQLNLENEKAIALDNIDLASKEAQNGNMLALLNAKQIYNNIEGLDVVNLEQGKLKVAGDSAEKITTIDQDLGKAKALVNNEVAQNSVDSTERAGLGQYKSIKTWWDRAREAVYNKYFAPIVSWWDNIQKMFAGDKSIGAGSFRQPNQSLREYETNSAQLEGVTFNVEGIAQFDGKSVGEWTNNERQISDAFKVEAQKRLQEISVQMGNLEALKNKNIAEIVSKFNPSKANGGDDTSKVEKALEASLKQQEEVAKAQKDAADEQLKASQELAKAIEAANKEAVSEVEKLQDRIVGALKKKYQEQYDARKKLLEKEQALQVKGFNDRIKQLNAEIDAINGETPEDKQQQLKRLQRELVEWQKDGSDVGLAKQKELSEAIAALKKEMSIDKLEDAIDVEQSKIDESNQILKDQLDQESPNYDSQLKELDNAMTEKMLYDQANDMIRNGKTDEIIALLTQYDAKFEGFAALMGETAGARIAAEVMKALNAYARLMNGDTSGLDGGSGGSGTGGTGSGGAGGQQAGIKETHTVQPGDTLWDLAERFYGDPYQWQKIYNANSGTVDDPNLIYPDQKLLIPFKIGGYTGNQDGVAYLHAQERVLTADQNVAFENLVYNIAPKLDKSLMSVQPVGNTASSIAYNKELVSVNVDKIVNNTPFDVANTENNLNRLFKNTLERSGMGTNL